jgi:hypothetical protein
MVSQIKVKGSKVKVKYSKFVIFTSNTGCSNQIAFKNGKSVKALEGIS